MANCHSSPNKSPQTTSDTGNQRASSLKGKILSTKARRQLSTQAKTKDADDCKIPGLTTGDLLLFYINFQLQYKMHEHQYYPNIALYYEYVKCKKEDNPQQEKLKQKTFLSRLKKSSIVIERQGSKSNSPILQTVIPEAKPKPQNQKKLASLSDQITQLQQKVDASIELGDSDELRFYFGKLGELCWRNGEYRRSITNLQQGLRICNLLHKPQSFQSAFFYSNLGLNYLKLKQNEHAFKYFQIALRINRSKKGQNSHGVATAYNNIGNIFKSKGRYQKALEYYSKSLRIKIKLFGMNNEGVAASLSNIALLQWENKNYNQGVDKYKEALRIYRQIFGQINLQISRTTYNLALCYHDMRQYKLWLEAHIESLVILQELKMSQHPSYTKRKAVFISNLNQMIKSPQQKRQIIQRALSLTSKLLKESDGTDIIKKLQQKLASMN